MVITVKDEAFNGKVLHEVELEFQEEKVNIENIIRQRVLQEVADYNQKMPAYFNGLVEPNEAEKTLNGYQLKAKKEIDGEQQVYIALDAFQKNGFFVLVDNLQAESLEQEVQLKKDTNISFIKLTPLVGG